MNSRSENVTRNAIINVVSFVAITILSFVHRKYFIYFLGDNLVGLHSVLNNIIGFLSIAELGIGTAIVFTLYKPMANNDKESVVGILNLYKKLYQFIAITILVLGIIVSVFLKYLVKDSVNMSQVYIYYYLFIFNTIMSYFFSYKNSMLFASQKMYIISLVDTLTKMGKFIVQLIILYLTKSYLLFILIEIVFNLIYYYLINVYTHKHFPWIKTIDGFVEEGTKKDIVKKVKALFYHKIGGFIVFNTDNLTLSYFTNLSTVAIFNNYQMIISFLSNLLSKIFEATTASLGHLLTENNEEKNYEIFKKMYFINFWITTIFIVCFYNGIIQFIDIWLGKDYLMQNSVVIVLLINFYITCMRASIAKFQDASGIFEADKYAPIFESIINLIFSITLAAKYGIIGVFIGTLISNVTVIIWVKPFVVYKHIFKKNVIEYFIKYIKYSIVAILILLGTNYLIQMLNTPYNILGFLINITISFVFANIIIFILFRKDIMYVINRGLILLNKVVKK